MLCKYKNIFGEPGKSVHSYRLYDIAVVDVLCTVILAFLIKRSLPGKSFICILISLFILGIVMHRMFCVRTTIDKLLFK